MSFILSLMLNIQSYSINAELWGLAPNENLKLVAEVITTPKQTEGYCSEIIEYSNYFFNRFEDEYSFGTLCGKNLMFFKGRLTTPDYFRFALAHEGFHFLIQEKSLKLPLKFSMIGRRTYQSGDVFESKLKSLFKYLITDKGSTLSCSKINNYLKGFSRAELDYINMRVHLEWPAEFYAVSHVFGKPNHEYSEIRNTLGKDPEKSIYLSAFYGMMSIEKNFTRKKWQTLVAQGYPILSLFLTSIGCSDKLQPELPLVQVDSQLLIPYN